MWFLLDESLERIAATDKPALAGIESLIDSAARGLHAIAAKQRTADELLERVDGIARKGYLRSIKQRAPQLLAELGLAEARIRITLDEEDLRRSTPAEWHANPSIFAKWSAPPSYLLSENLSDCRAYELAARHFIAINRRSTTVRLKHLNGGGAETPKVFSHEIKQRDGLTLCITDTDRKSPSCSINSTSSQCRNHENNSSWIASHLDTDGREAENIVPSNVLLDAIVEEGQEPTKSNLLTLLASYENDVDGWMFLDLKNGTALCKNDCPTFPFWSKRTEYECCSFCDSFNKKTSTCDSKECKCQLAPPICERLLEKFNDFAARQSIHSTADRAKTSKNNRHWLRIGSYVAAWGAAARPMRS